MKNKILEMKCKLCEEEFMKCKCHDKYSRILKAVWKHKSWIWEF